MIKNEYKVKSLLLGGVFLGFVGLTKAQNVGINSTGAAPDVSAILDVSSANKGMLVPRVALTSTNDVATISAPTTSLLVYNTSTVSDVTPGFYYFDGALWVRIVSGSVVGTDDQNLTSASLSGTTLTVAIEGGNPVSVDLATLQDGTGTDDQNLTSATLSGTSLTINIENGNPVSVDLAALQDGTGTDDQNLTSATLSGTNLTINIENGNPVTVDLSSLQDGTGTDSQTLSLSGSTLSISGGNNVTLTDNVNDADADATNEIQSLSVSGSTLSLSNGGGSVTLPSGADNLGNHTATQNIDLATSKLVGNGGSTGILIQNDGHTRVENLPQYDISTDTLFVVADSPGNLHSMSLDSLISIIKGELNYVEALPRSCKEILDNGNSTGDGVYTISPDGISPVQCHCDMTTDGGGWTLVLKSMSTTSNFSYNDARWSSGALLNQGDFNLSGSINSMYDSYNFVAGDDILLNFSTYDDMVIPLPNTNTVKHYATTETVIATSDACHGGTPPAFYAGKVWDLQTGSTAMVTYSASCQAKVRLGIVSENLIASYPGIGWDSAVGVGIAGPGGSQNSGVVNWSGSTCPGTYGGGAGFDKLLVYIR